jgi:perosamine synthetase
LDKFIPYGRHCVGEEDIAAVCEVLRSDWLTTGHKVAEFEEAFAAATGAKHAVAVSSGTAALHAAAYAAGIGPGDEVIVPPITFAATANCAVYLGGVPVFADVDPETLLLDPDRAEAKITPRTKAIIAVDYAGQPCDYDSLHQIADRFGLMLIDDASHAAGARYKGRPAGALAHLNTFSFHPVKAITTGEGGMITTGDAELAERMRVFRTHGITSGHRERHEAGSWFYEMVDLGFNYRITDIQCALGLSQLRKLPGFLARRREIARRYDAAFEGILGISTLRALPEIEHAYHLYVVRLDRGRLRASRGEIFSALREEGIGVNVHYIPVHLHPFYRQRFGTGPGDCPVAEAAYEQILSLPIFPAMSDGEVEQTIAAVEKVVRKFLT